MKLASLAALASLIAFGRSAIAAKSGYLLETDGSLPFAVEELAYAVGARVTLSDDSASALGVIKVTPAGQGRASVRLGDKARVLSLGGRTGAAAARVVALVVSDLVLEQPALEPMAPVPDEPVPAPAPAPAAASPTPGAPTPAPVPAAGKPAAPAKPAASAKPAGKPPDVVSDVDDDVADRHSLTMTSSGAAARRERWTLLVMPGVGQGTNGDEPLTESVATGATWPTGSARLMTELTLVRTPTQHVADGSGISMLAASLHGAVGGRLGPLEAYLGPYLAVYELDGPHPFGVLVGAGARVLASQRVSGRLSLVLGLGVDAAVNRIAVQIGGQTAFATPRLGGSLSAGLGWTF